jgi:hypothetical protein
MSDISNSDDIIDSRDVIARIEELENDRAAEVKDDAGDCNRLFEWDDANGHELAALKAFAAEGANYAPDWEHGETCIRDSYFKEYAQELAEDIGAINADATWPNSCIDWDCAAHQLKQDYTAVDFDGVTYWVR